MPAKDKTGPEGRGPLTGRGLGPCQGGQSFGRGFGRGLGFGRGRRFGMQLVQPVQSESKESLQQELVSLEADQKAVALEIEAVKKRLSEEKEE